MEGAGYKADLSPVLETSYLTAQNVRQYRAIMRLFFGNMRRCTFSYIKRTSSN